MSSSSSMLNSPQFAAVMKELDKSTIQTEVSTKPDLPQTPVIQITCPIDGDSENGDVCSIREEQSAFVELNKEQSEVKSQPVDKDDATQKLEEEDKDFSNKTESSGSPTAKKHSKSSSTGNVESFQRRKSSSSPLPCEEEGFPNNRESTTSNSPKLKRNGLQADRKEDCLTQRNMGSLSARRGSVGQMDELKKASPRTRRKTVSVISNSNNSDANEAFLTGTDLKSTEQQTCQTGRKNSKGVCFVFEKGGNNIKQAHQIKRTEMIDLSFSVTKKKDADLNCRDEKSAAPDSPSSENLEEENNVNNLERKLRSSSLSPIPRRKYSSSSVLLDCDTSTELIANSEKDQSEVGETYRTRGASFPGSSGALLRRRSTERPSLCTRGRSMSSTQEMPSRRQQRTSSKSPPGMRRKTSESGVNTGRHTSPKGKTYTPPPSRRISHTGGPPNLMVSKPVMRRSCGDLQQLLKDEESQGRANSSLGSTGSSWTRKISVSKAPESGMAPRPPMGSPVVPRMERMIYLSAASGSTVQRSKSWSDLSEATMMILDEACKDDGIPQESLPEVSMEEVLRSWKTNDKHYNMISSVINPRLESNVDFTKVKGCRYIRKAPSP